MSCHLDDTFLGIAGLEPAINKFWAYRVYQFRQIHHKMWARADSNRRLHPYQGCTLPTELRENHGPSQARTDKTSLWEKGYSYLTMGGAWRGRYASLGAGGLEPPTFGLKDRCSTNLSYAQKKAPHVYPTGVEPVLLVWKTSVLPVRRRGPGRDRTRTCNTYVQNTRFPRIKLRTDFW